MNKELITKVMKTNENYISLDTCGSQLVSQLLDGLVEQRKEGPGACELVLSSSVRSFVLSTITEMWN